MITIKELININKQIKIIFLDIDGVLNNGIMTSDEYLQIDIYGSQFSTQNIQNLKKIIDETAAYIVVSSTWRHNATPDEKIVGLEYLQNMWKDRNLPGEVIDITPYYFVNKGPNNQLDSLIKPSCNSIPRGYEIKMWLFSLGYGYSKSIISNYVILDDDQDMLYEQRNNFIKIDAMYGLTKENTKETIKLLNHVI